MTLSEFVFAIGVGGLAHLTVAYLLFAGILPFYSARFLEEEPTAHTKFQYSEKAEMTFFGVLAASTFTILFFVWAWFGLSSDLYVGLSGIGAILLSRRLRSKTYKETGGPLEWLLLLPATGGWLPFISAMRPMIVFDVWTIGIAAIAFAIALN